MNQYAEMFSGIDATGLTIIGAIVVVALLAIFVVRGFKHAGLKENLETFKVTQQLQKDHEEKAKAEGKVVVPSILGTGKFKCVCYRKHKQTLKTIEDWNLIPYPIGELYQSEPGNPWVGGVYLVEETDEGEIIDYDPRKVEVHSEQTPFYAWSSTHCRKIVVNFWTTPSDWWKSPAKLFAGAMLIMTFIFGLVVLGGG